MKILTLISGGDVGGAKTHVLSLLKKLNETISADLVCFMEGDFSEDARTMGIPTTVISGGIIKSLRELREIIAEGNYDIIHSHGSRGNFLASLIKKRCKLPLVSTVHSDYRLDYMGRPLANLIYGTLNKLSLRKMDYLIGISDSTSELLIDRGFSPDNIFTIYNGIDLDKPSAAMPRDDFLSTYALSIPADSLLLGIAARLNPVKDITTLIRGFARACEKSQALHLLIAGEGPELESLKELAVQLSVADKITFLGWLHDMDSFYSAIDINVLTSLSETFAYALTEGARFSCATISTNVGGAPYLIDNGINGLLFNPGDHETLARCILALASNPNMRLRFGTKLHEKVALRFSLTATCRDQISIYDSVLSHSKLTAKYRYGIAICGAYGMGNVGDEAILEAILAEIRDVDPDIPIFVLSKNPRETARKHRVRSVHTFSIFPFFKISSKIRLYINGGGSLIQDGTSRRSLWFYLYTIATAKMRGAKVIMYGCGIGPVLYNFDRRLAAYIINKYVDIITLREDGSLEELRDMDISTPDIRLAADPAIALKAAHGDQVSSAMLSLGLIPSGRYFCFMLRKWQGFDAKLSDFARCADYISEKYALTPVFFPIDYKKDVEPAMQVTKLMKRPFHIISEPLSSGITIGIMSRMSAVISMRLHGLIFASGHGAPLVGIVYDPKVSAFLRYIGQSNYMNLDDVTEHKLVAAVETALSRDSSESQLDAVARIWELEKINRRALEELISPDFI